MRLQQPVFLYHCYASCVPPPFLIPISPSSPSSPQLPSEAGLQPLPQKVDRAFSALSYQVTRLSTNNLMPGGEWRRNMWNVQCTDSLFTPITYTFSVAVLTAMVTNTAEATVILRRAFKHLLLLRRGLHMGQGLFSVFRWCGLPGTYFWGSRDYGRHLRRRSQKLRPFDRVQSRE